jgi:hypothetical protein
VLRGHDDQFEASRLPGCFHRLIKVRQREHVRPDRAQVELTGTDQREQRQIGIRRVHEIPDDFQVVEHHLEIVERNRSRAAAHQHDAASTIHAYSLIQARLDVNPGDVLFVSSNPWDAIGAKAVGLKVAWIERVTQEALADACRKRDLVVPLTMFKALRMQMDELDMAPGYKVNGLSALPDILPASKNS